MKINKSIVVIVIAIFITACNSSAGVSSDSTQNSGFKGEFSLSNSDTKNASSTNRSTSKQQILTSIISAAMKTTENINNNYFLVWENEDAEKYKAGNDFAIKVAEANYKWMNGNGDRLSGGGGVPFDEKVFSDVDGVREFGKTLKLPDQVDDWFSPLDEKIKKAIQGDAVAGTDFFLRLKCLNNFIGAIEPSNGWIKYDGLNRDQSENLYINRKTRQLYFANLFASEIERILPKSYKNPADMRNDFIVALNKIPNESIYAMFKQADSEAAAALLLNVTIDSVSGKGTSWTAGPSQYEGQRTGWTLRTGGQTIFGQGYINGQLHEIEIASALEVSSKVERSNKNSGTIGADESSKANVGVK